MIQKMNQCGRSILIAATLFLIVSFFPGVSAGDPTPLSYTEGFEEDATLGPPSSSLYTHATNGMNSFVNSAQAHSGTNSFRAATQTNGATFVNYASFAYNAPIDFCQGIPYRFWVMMPSLPGTGSADYFYIGATGAALNSIQIQDTGQIAGNFGTPAGAIMPTNQWVDFTLSFTAPSIGVYPAATASCPNSASISATYCASSNALSFSLCSTFNQVISSTVKRTFGYTSQSSPAPYTRAVYLDDIGPLVSVDNTVKSFCADPNVINFDGNSATPTTTTGASDDYGYDYRRGGTFFQDGDNPAGIGLSSGFDYSGTSSAEGQWDYSAKHLSTGTKAMHENITIEADDSGSTSKFRVNFHTAVSSNPDDTAKGNGLNTGHFADHVEARFQEDGNDWQISFWYAKAALNGGDRTQLGGSVNYGTPNDAKPYTIWFDSRATALGPPDSAFGGSGGNLVAGPYIAITVPVSTSGEPNGIVAYRSLVGISGNPFAENVVGDVWNIGEGDVGLLSSTWHTAIDENIQQGDDTSDEGGFDSTCIFDDAGTAVFANSQGGTPQSTLPPSDSTTTTSTAPTNPGGGLVGSQGAAHTTGNPLGNFIAYQNVAWGFDVSAIFAGIVLLVLLVVVLAATKGNLFAGMITVLVVGGIEVALGLFGVAMMFLLALLCAGFAAGGIFQARNQGGDTA